jgi:hypothetical protein
MGKFSQFLVAVGMSCLLANGFADSNIIIKPAEVKKKYQEISQNGELDTENKKKISDIYEKILIQWERIEENNLAQKVFHESVKTALQKEKKLRNKLTVLSKNPPKSPFKILSTTSLVEMEQWLLRENANFSSIENEFLQMQSVLEKMELQRSDEIREQLTEKKNLIR